VVFPARRRIIEIRGCFWHRHPGCRCASTPATRSEYWQTKFATNVARDVRNLAALHAAGWSLLVVWEFDVANPSLAERLTEFLGPPGPARCSPGHQRAKHQGCLPVSPPGAARGLGSNRHQ
jgi:G:T-mismatch repair DNA endonuclease (very short patch repair protein)